MTGGKFINKDLSEEEAAKMDTEKEEEMMRKTLHHKVDTLESGGGTNLCPGGKRLEDVCQK